MVERNIKQAARLLAILVLGFLIVVYREWPAFIRFLLVVWVVGTAFEFSSHKPIKQEVLPVDLSKMKIYQASDDGKTSDEIISIMEEEGYRPATLVETLVWRRANPDTLQNSHTLIALGSSRIENRIRRVPGIIIGKNESPNLYFDVPPNEWENDYRFLGIKISS